MKKASLFILPFLALIILPLTAQAYEVKTGNNVFIAESEKLNGNVFVAGSMVTVSAPVEGDLFCAGQSITIDAKVAGDVFCAGQNITINGEVGGSVRAVGNTVSVNGKVARNVQILGASLTLGPKAEAGWEMFIAGAFADIRGKIGRTLHGTAQSVTISGEVGGDVKMRLESDMRKEKGISNNDGETLTVADSAKIGGNIFYTAVKPGQISDKATVGGEVGYSEPKVRAQKSRDWGGAGSSLFSIFAALVIGLVLISLWREPIKKITDLMFEKKTAAIGWGAVVLFLGPFVLVILVITLIGLPLALILFALWLIAICLSKILVGIMVGRSLMDRFSTSKKDSLIWAMILGIVVVWLVTSIPFIGWLAGLLAVLWGLGGMWLYFKENK